MSHPFIAPACKKTVLVAGGAGYIGAHISETHRIPRTREVALGPRPHLSIFGDDDETPDDTCVRDCIHVDDLCQAHLLALEALDPTDGSLAVNLGNGPGSSVKETTDMARCVTRQPIPVRHCPRRAGDPAWLIADSSRTRELPNWQPAVPQLHTIIEHAWQWSRQQARPSRSD